MDEAITKGVVLEWYRKALRKYISGKSSTLITKAAIELVNMGFIEEPLSGIF